MNTLAYVNQKIAEMKLSGKPIADCIWETAQLCIGWPYIFGDRGQQCTPAQRRNVYNKHPDQEGLVSKCKALSLDGGKAVITGNCSGCKWYPGGNRVGSFDCRGYTYWNALQYGVEIKGVGCTDQWNTEANWVAKGSIDTVPEDLLVCLFYKEKKNPNKMAHTGFGYHGETIECGNGVVYSKVRNKKWEYWAIPKGLYEGDIPIPTPSGDTEPVLKKGSKGSYVSLLQTQLLNRGYKLPKYGADGSFGAETEAAVKLFQQDWGLPVTGIVDEATWKLLESSPERQKLYTVTIPHLDKEQADELLKKYTGTATLET